MRDGSIPTPNQDLSISVDEAAQIVAYLINAGFDVQSAKEQLAKLLNKIGAVVKVA